MRTHTRTSNGSADFFGRKLGHRPPVHSPLSLLPSFLMPGPHFCIGPVTGGQCRLGSGGARVSVKGKCKRDRRCGEKRCASHCKCARMGWLSGRRAGRPRVREAATAMPEANASATLVRAPVAPPLAPVGRQSNTEVKVFPVDAWYGQMRRDIAAVKGVLLSSLVYDNPDVQKLLVMKLKERHRKPFALTVLIDAASFNGSLPARQQGRIRSLRANGASVFLCRGDRLGYPFHKKAVVIDRRYLYSGGANVTYASERGNGELVFRMMGPVVLETMATLAIDQARGREWL